MEHPPLTRFVMRSLADRLRVMPVVVVTGARQTGKSTLVHELAPEGRRYVTLDDLDMRDLAHRDPDALLGDSQTTTIDEIQREPAILHAIKRAVDRRRKPGQFVLTGSANLLMMNRVAESLAGRASYLTLWPLTRSERRGEGSCGLWSELLSARDESWLDLLRAQPTTDEDWTDVARCGGFPWPALRLSSRSDRAVWFDGYVRTYLERDLQDLSAVSSLTDFRRLMRAASLRVGQLVNQAELGRDVAMTQPTVHRYLNLLEVSYVIVRIPAFATNRTKRLIKSPKLYWSDVGLALHLAGVDEPSGAHLENLVFQDLLAWRDARTDRAEVTYWRTALGEEVDFVVEAGGHLLPIEIKATTRPRLADARHLLAFRSEYGRKARAGLLLHTGTATEWLASGILATPWWRVL